MNKFITRIQSRLSRRDVKVCKDSIRVVYHQLVKNINNPTEDDLISVVEHFVNQASKLATVSEEVEETTEIALVELAEDADDNTHDFSTITSEETSEIVLIESVENTNDSISTITLENKSELVTDTARTMGIALNIQEVVSIAENLNYISDDFQESLTQVGNAITAFIQHKGALNSQKIAETISNITQVAAEEFNQNSQQLTTGLQGINSQMHQQNMDFKSRIRAAVAALEIPGIKI